MASPWHPYGIHLRIPQRTSEILKILYEIHKDIYEIIKGVYEILKSLRKSLNPEGNH